MNIIPYGRQNIDQNDINAVVECLTSDYLTQGPKIDELETKFAKYVGSKYAVAVSNGTAALHLSALTLGVDFKSNVITTPITFAATANCIRYCGGSITLVDIDPETYLMDKKKLIELLEKSEKGKFQGIILVDFAGRPILTNEFKEIADKYKLWILEDSCHSPGGYYLKSDGSKIKCGSNLYSDLSIFSFHPVKHIAAGEGGMITTNNKNYYHKLKKLRTHGITKNPNEFIQPYSSKGSYPSFYMEMQELGYNYRLTDFQSALAISQLEKANDGIKIRRSIAKRYYKSFYRKKYILNQSGFIHGHAYHLYIIETNNRDELYEYLKNKGIYTQVHYIPLHYMPYYKNLATFDNLGNSEIYFSRCLSLPMYPSLSEKEQEYVINSIHEFFEK